MSAAVSSAEPSLPPPIPQAFFRSRVVVNGHPEYRVELGEGGGYASLHMFAAYRIEGANVLLLAHAGDDVAQWVIRDADLAGYLQQDEDALMANR